MLEAVASATSAGPHTRAAASNWALSSLAARSECVAQPGAWTVPLQQARMQALPSWPELWHRQDGAVNRLAEQHSGEVAVRVDRLLVAPALQLVRVIDLPPVVEASLLLVLRQRRRGTAARRGGAARGEGWEGLHAGDAAQTQNGAPRSRAGC